MCCKAVGAQQSHLHQVAVENADSLECAKHQFNDGSNQLHTRALLQVRQLGGDGPVPVTAEVLVGPLLSEVRLYFSEEAQLTVRCANSCCTRKSCCLLRSSSADHAAISLLYLPLVSPHVNPWISNNVHNRHVGC